MTIGRRLLAGIPSLFLAAAFAFFGYFKTFAPLAVLAQHHAWTIVLPEWLGRLVGITELMAAAALLAGSILRSMHRYVTLAAAYLVANQACAAVIHLTRGETAALPQNGVIVALALIVIAALRIRPATDQPREIMG